MQAYCPLYPLKSLCESRRALNKHLYWKQLKTEDDSTTQRVGPMQSVRRATWNTLLYRKVATSGFQTVSLKRTCAARFSHTCSVRTLRSALSVVSCFLWSFMVFTLYVGCFWMLKTLFSRECSTLTEGNLTPNIKNKGSYIVRWTCEFFFLHQHIKVNFRFFLKTDESISETVILFRIRVSVPSTWRLRERFIFTVW